MNEETESVTEVQFTDLSSFENNQDITEIVAASDSEYPIEEVTTTYDIEVVTTLDNYAMYETIHQDLTNITGLLCILFVIVFLYLLVRYINKIYHYLFH